MEVKLSGIFKAIIPQTQMCRDLFTDIFQKEYHRQKKFQANEEACSVLQKQ
jgi:predicted nucleic acid-binding Zn ribbon protein